MVQKERMPTQQFSVSNRCEIMSACFFTCSHTCPFPPYVFDALTVRLLTDGTGQSSNGAKGSSVGLINVPCITPPTTTSTQQRGHPYSGHFNFCLRNWPLFWVHKSWVGKVCGLWTSFPLNRSEGRKVQLVHFYQSMEPFVMMRSILILDQCQLIFSFSHVKF